MIVLGLMSGTSLDGIDAAVVEIRPRDAGYALDCKRFVTVPFAPTLRSALLAALPPNQPAPADIAYLDVAFGAALRDAAMDVAVGFSLDAVASHGLTLYHRGEAGQTVQIGSPYALRDALGATVVYDFRRADCARGGHGAPLVPHFDALIFGEREGDVVALNLGGIANVSVVPSGSFAVTAAWDTGPANMLIDAFVDERSGGASHVDAQGAFATAGAADAGVLRALCDDARDYLGAAPPKSTGRERFGAQLLARHHDRLATLTLAEGCATLAAFTVETIASSLERFGPSRARLVASGGGTHNAALMSGLRDRLLPRGWEVVTSQAYGIDPDAKEALAFALLACETLRGRPANVPRATGASAPAVLGSIVPCRLERLLAKIAAEDAANATV